VNVRMEWMSAVSATTTVICFSCSRSEVGMGSPSRCQGTVQGQRAVRNGTKGQCHPDRPARKRCSTWPATPPRCPDPPLPEVEGEAVDAPCIGKERVHADGNDLSRP